MQRALIIDGNPIHGSRLGAALRAVVDDVSVVSSLFHADVTVDWDLILMDLDTLSLEEREQFVGMLAPDVAHGRVIVMTHQLTDDLLATLVEDVGFLNIMRKGMRDEVAHLVASARKLRSKEIFGLQKYLRWGGRITRLVTPAELSASQTQAFTAEFLSFHRIGGATRRRVLDTVSAFVEGARQDNLGASQVEFLELTLGFDGSRLGVSVADSGPMSEDGLRDGLQRRMRALHSSEEPVSRICHALRHVSHLIFNIAPGARAESIALFDMSVRRATHHAAPESMQLFLQ